MTTIMVLGVVCLVGWVTAAAVFRAAVGAVTGHPEAAKAVAKTAAKLAFKGGKNLLG